MSVKNLLHLCCGIVMQMTLKHSKQLMNNEELWTVIYEIWSYIAVLPSHNSELYYRMLNKYCHFLSHDCKASVKEITGFPTLNSDEVFNILVTCQSPKLIFDYRMKRQKITPSQTIPLTNKLVLKNYFQNFLSELDLSGADFYYDDTLLVKLLPMCHSLKILCLGNSGSEAVLESAKNCPLIKLQVEERFPLQPKLPQDTVLKYILGYTGNINALNNLLDLCKYQAQLGELTPEEHQQEASLTSSFLEDFLDKCKPSWPNLNVLLLGNCRICREALMLCLIVLKKLEEIMVMRIQTDEILNTCDRVFSAFGAQFQISIKRLTLWAGWSGLNSKTLKIAPNTEDLSLLIAYGYSKLNLQEVFENNETLTDVTTLSLVGLRNAGPSVFYRFSPFLTRIRNLKLCGYIITTEEIVNILLCLPHLLSLQVDYSELRNYSHILTNRKYPKNSPLTSLSIETSYVDSECINSIFIMAPNISNLSIRGKTRSFSLSFSQQQIFLRDDTRIKYLELYPQFPLDIPRLVTVARSKYSSGERPELRIALSSLTKEEFLVLSNCGWYIFPLCSRC